MTNANNQTAAFLINARAAVDEFERVTAARGIDWNISWKWAGRSRHGVLTLTREGEVLFQTTYARNTQMFRSSDHGLKRIHAGAPKHRALVEALQYLQNA